MADLPIVSVLDELRATLRRHPAAVLVAPPGAGKTTGVPPALLAEPWLAGRRIVMLEPRRLAARAAAQRLADNLGEPLGETAGFRIRLESCVGPRTRIEVVTEGILTRRLQQDPELAGVGLVIFDEFHERSLTADLGLALCLEAQAALRPDLRLLVMSATLDAEPVAALMGDAPVVRAEGRAYPVETRYVPRPASGPLDGAVASAILRTLDEESGNLLVFLPGAGEIQRLESRLRAAVPPGVRIAPLYGDLARGEQDFAIAPSPPGERKVVLATSIAETSLTIEGIRVVLDVGLMRTPRFDPTTGMTRLYTLPVSMAAADQRRGRAGRLGPGICLRLWPTECSPPRPATTTPEILAADLAPLVLELAQWGTRDPRSLRWLDPPPPAHVSQARELLVALGALAENGDITAHGRQLLELPMHPRLAHMVVRGAALGLGALACELAALVSERDIVVGQAGYRDADLRVRVEALRGGVRGRLVDGVPVDPEAVRQVRRVAQDWQRRLPRGGRPTPADELEKTGLLLAFAYPDRIAQKRESDGRFRLANGRGAVFHDPQPLGREEYLVAAHLDGDGREARIFLAAPLAAADLLAHFRDAMRAVADVRWDSKAQEVVAQRETFLGELLIATAPLHPPPADLCVAAMLAGVRDLGLAALPWNDELEDWRARIAWLRRLEGPAAWPDFSDAALLATLDEWLAPALAGKTRAAHLQRVPLRDLVTARLTWEQRRALDERAPTHLTVATGSRLRLDYRSGDTPILPVRLQELFGTRTTPRIGGGKVPVLLHLLSPARRPVQVTQDLASFWANTYVQVRKDLRGRYPKHSWPDDPLAAPPTRGVRRREE